MSLYTHYAMQYEMQCSRHSVENIIIYISSSGRIMIMKWLFAISNREHLALFSHSQPTFFYDSINTAEDNMSHIATVDSRSWKYLSWKYLKILKIFSSIFWNFNFSILHFLFQMQSCKTLKLNYYSKNFRYFVILSKHVKLF